MHCGRAGRGYCLHTVPPNQLGREQWRQRTSCVMHATRNRQHATRVHEMGNNATDNTRRQVAADNTQTPQRRPYERQHSRQLTSRGRRRSDSARSRAHVRGADLATQVMDHMRQHHRLRCVGDADGTIRRSSRPLDDGRCLHAEPRFMLAPVAALAGACMVALGGHHVHARNIGRRYSLRAGATNSLHGPPQEER